MTRGQEGDPQRTATAAASLVTVFSVAGREYAIGVESVIEAVRMVALTPLPQAAPWQAGALNLRGHVIPVVDLRQRLGSPPCEPSLDTRILVVEEAGTTAGLLVDEIIGVETPLEAAPEPASGDPFTRAILRSGDRLVVALDVAAVLAEARDTEDGA